MRINIGFDLLSRVEDTGMKRWMKKKCYTWRAHLGGDIWHCWYPSGGDNKCRILMKIEWKDKRTNCVCEFDHGDNFNFNNSKLFFGVVNRKRKGKGNWKSVCVFVQFFSFINIPIPYWNCVKEGGKKRLKETERDELIVRGSFFVFYIFLWWI